MVVLMIWCGWYEGIDADVDDNDYDSVIMILMTAIIMYAVYNARIINYISIAIQWCAIEEMCWIVVYMASGSYIAFLGVSSI